MSKMPGEMLVVAMIEYPKELGKIIEWAKQQEKSLPETVCARSPPEPALTPALPKNYDWFSYSGWENSRSWGKKPNF